MKLLLTCALLVLTNSMFCQTAPDVQKATLSKNNYKIQYPRSWSLDTSKAMHTEFYIFSPQKDTAEIFRENVNLIIQDFTGNNIDLEKYKEITDGEMKQAGPDITMFESSVLKSDKGDYYRAVYSMTQDGFRMKLLGFCYIRNDKAYLLTFASDFDKYDKDKKVGEEILNSFSLTK